MITYCIYRIVNFRNGKAYIGQTKRKDVRENFHFCALKNSRHTNKHLQNAYNKSGRQAFFFEVIESDIPTTIVDDREKHWIAYFDSYANGYNGTEGGKGNLRPLTKECEWNGIKYPSITAAAQANGVPLETMSTRLRRGHTCDSGVLRGVECEWNGVKYPSIAEAAKSLGLKESPMRSRLIRGFTCDADMPGKTKPCEWNGISYDSVDAAAKANNISFAAMAYRIRSGYTKDSDMPGTDNLPNKSKECIWNGIIYKSISEAAKRLGVDSKTMRRRIKNGYQSDHDMNKRRVDVTLEADVLQSMSNADLDKAGYPDYSIKLAAV